MPAGEQDRDAAGTERVQGPPDEVVVEREPAGAVRVVDAYLAERDVPDGRVVGVRAERGPFQWDGPDIGVGVERARDPGAYLVPVDAGELDGEPGGCGAEERAAPDTRFEDGPASEPEGGEGLPGDPGDCYRGEVGGGDGTASVQEFGFAEEVREPVRDGLPFSRGPGVESGCERSPAGPGSEHVPVGSCYGSLAVGERAESFESEERVPGGGRQAPAAGRAGVRRRRGRRVHRCPAVGRAKDYARGDVDGKGGPRQDVRGRALGSVRHARRYLAGRCRSARFALAALRRAGGLGSTSGRYRVAIGTAGQRGRGAQGRMPEAKPMRIPKARTGSLFSVTAQLGPGKS